VANFYRGTHYLPFTNQGGDAYACVGICILALIVKLKEKNMIGIEQYQKIQEYKALGLA